MKINAWIRNKFVELSIDDAAREITGDWIGSGWCCERTTEDLAEALRAAVELRNAALAVVGSFRGQNNLTAQQAEKVLVEAIKPLL